MIYKEYAETEFIPPQEYLLMYSSQKNIYPFVNHKSQYTCPETVRFINA